MFVQKTLSLTGALNNADRSPTKMGAQFIICMYEYCFSNVCMSYFSINHDSNIA